MLLNSDFSNGTEPIYINPSDSVDAMLKKSGLNWEVTQQDMFFDFEGKKIPANKKALIQYYGANATSGLAALALHLTKLLFTFMNMKGAANDQWIAY